MCHLLLVLPVIALLAFWFWPLSIALPVYAGVVVISLAFYTLLMRAMRRPVRTGREELLHSTATVLRSDGPRAVWVRVHGEEWKALSKVDLAEGDTVRVIGVEGMTLRVAPEPAGSGADAAPAA